jgi:pyruvate/2-oxoglutarate dehydrogenase complex dihydrolipoamide dehydrogenase (E3) component
MLAAHRNESLIKGENIVVCGGGASGCDGALELAKDKGKKVTLVEMMDECAKDAMFINKISLFNQLEQYGVTLMTGTKVVSIEDDGLVVEKKDGTQEKLLADTVINAFGMRQDLKTVDAIKAKYHIKTRVVGDSVKLGKIGDAIRDGFGAATTL